MGPAQAPRPVGATRVATARVKRTRGMHHANGHGRSSVRGRILCDPCDPSSMALHSCGRDARQSSRFVSLAGGRHVCADACPVDEAVGEERDCGEPHQQIRYAERRTPCQPGEADGRTRARRIRTWPRESRRPLRSDLPRSGRAHRTNTARIRHLPPATPQRLGLPWTGRLAAGRPRRRR